jgi:NAD(P)-dependent dehydrogenase (short-subunit alcohol dehydrogenase family)
VTGLADKALLVVGGASGIGLAAATIAARDGARVVVADIDETQQAAVEALDGEATFIHCDARDRASAHDAITETLDRHERIDALLTTVGGAHVAELDDVSPEEWDAEIAFNLTSVYSVCHAALPVFRDQRSGAIVVTSSGYAVMPGADRPGYVAAKAGVIAFTRSLAATLARCRVRVNCLAPGPTDTPRFRAMNGGDVGVERVRASMPLGEIPTPEDCANVALFLLSDAARQVTGQTIHVNGGLLMP